MPSTERGNIEPSRGSAPGLPVRYRCKVGGEWKSLQFFSKNQQSLLQRQTSVRGCIDAANSGMTCIEHSANCRREIRCELCGLVKSIDQFSKSMRRSDDPTCLQCTAWGEVQEPGVTPAPLQTGHRLVEEENRDIRGKRFVESTDFVPSAMPQPPTTAMSSLGIGGGSTGGHSHARLGGPSSSRGPSSVVSAPVSVASSGPTPPHLESIVSKLMQRDGLVKSSSADDGSESAASSAEPVTVQGWLAGNQAPPVDRSASGRGSEDDGSDAGRATLSNLNSCLPPHIRAKMSSTASRAALFQPAVPGSSSRGSEAGSISTATTMRREQDNVRRTPYNAWDNAGKLHKAIKSPTVSDGDAASTTSNVLARHVGTSGHGGSRVPTTKQDAPKSKNAWFKAPMHRPDPQAAADRMSAGPVDPDIDRQRLMNYCDSEGSRR
ncbi:uncharacterized protein MAM_04123 [Metarhizium album ARSEF 1941]|uniref:Stc1 domain-containing protein n=1 Tax=Metarhizium album (strain ARSEF 1941) TaxID=1081103 RepID=A0A0B2WVW3_METAS|nr:uncharacterized protein MAM_04123 [Metarhizium album ARSEF 1941]KHN97734.1 hypothetical protein MAM_04123 [Metarhizium album ARSEF 1941]